MSTYIVTRRYVCEDRFEVEAGSREQAKEAAQNEVLNFSTRVVRDLGYAVKGKKPRKESK